jgi:2-phosphosulfolactate phosphatase
MSNDDNIRTIEVCFSPVLFPQRLTTKNFVVVIVDILRATTAICTAFENGAMEVIPVAEIEDTKKYRGLGYKVAGERDGIVIDGADFGNSPFNFTKQNVNGEKIVITTTNGTQTIDITKICDTVVLGAFSNISVLAEWLDSQMKNVVILCAGWKNKFNIEDSIFAGALIDRLLKKPNYKVICDSAMAALDLWSIARNDVLNYIEKAAHRHRLKKLGLDDVLDYCFTEDTTPVIPVLYGGKLVNALKKK